MARRDKDEKRERRARAEVETKIARQRFGEAVDAWLSLPAADREKYRAQLATGTCAEIERAHRNRDTPAQLAWLKRIEQAPDLLPSGEEAFATRWHLLVAALCTRQWQRARAHVEVLESSMGTSALLSTIRTIIATEGSPPRGTLPDTAAEDARLGYESVRTTQTTYAAPAKLEDVETCCLVCFVNESWSRFHDIVRGWVTPLPEPISREVQRIAAELSERELIRRLSAKQRDALTVARFIAACTVGAGAPPELEGVVALSMRAVAMGTTEIIEDRGVVETCYEVSAAALRYPRLVPLLETLATSALYGLQVARSAERLLCRLIEHHSTTALVFKAAYVISLENDSAVHARTAPEWLAQAFEGLLAEPAALTKHFEQIVQAPSKQRTAHGIERIFDVLPVPLAVKSIDVVWSHSGEELRKALAEEARKLLMRMQLGASSSQTLDARMFRTYLRDIGSELADIASDEELRAFLKTPEGRETSREIMVDMNADVLLQGENRKYLDQLAQHAAVYDVGVLDVVLRHIRSRKEKAGWIERFWARRPTLRERVRDLHEGYELEDTAALLEKSMLTGITPSASDAASAFDYASRSEAPFGLCKELARILIEAIEREPEAEDDPVIENFVAIARALFPRPRRKAAKKKAKKAKTSGKSRSSKKSTQEQMSLDLDKEST